MRPVVVTAVLLLVVLMSMSASAAWNPKEMCLTKYHHVTKCRIDADWVQFGKDRCLKVFHSSFVNNANARKKCKTYANGELVSIHSVAELEQVECAMYWATTTRLLYWIGLHRGGKGFVWTDGTKHDYSKWFSGQPDNSWWDEHCVEMNYRGWGLWNDAACYWSHPYVCQITL